MDVAVKTLLPEAAASEGVAFLQEAVIMSQFTHEHVVTLIGVVTEGQPLMIVLEYMQHGALNKLLREKRWPDHKKLQSAHEVGKGLTYLASLKFAHRDIAARNVLVDSRSSCKIGDFGMARTMLDNDYYKAHGGKIPLRWTAPEAINYGKYSLLSDIWSFGIFLNELYTDGRIPYAEQSNEEVMAYVDQGYRLPRPPECPEQLYELMLAMWHPAPEQRPPMQFLTSRIGVIRSNLTGATVSTMGTGSVASMGVGIPRTEYYHEGISREEAEKRIKDYKDLDGAFLVRKRDNGTSYALTVIHDYDVSVMLMKSRCLTLIADIPPLDRV